MKKNFDEIILELPEINLNEKRTRFGNCQYGENGFGGCFDGPGYTGYGTAPGSSTPQWVNNMSNGQGPGGSYDGGASSDNYGESSGQWVDQPCAACADAESPRPVTQPGLGTLIRDNYLHRDGCGGQYRPELRNQAWQPCSEQ